MVNLSILDKEQTIISTLLECNNEIRKVNKLLNNKSLERKVNLYHFNFGNLFSELNPLFENDNSISSQFTKVSNTRNNYYAYFQKVKQFIDGYEPNVQSKLNESLKVDIAQVENPVQINFTTFNQDLNKLIKLLEKKDDFTNLSPEVLKIKTLANKPILIFGYDICNNLQLKSELHSRFNIQESDLISICYEKTKNQLYFVTDKSLVVYDVKEDVLDYYQNVNKDRPIKSTNFHPDTYLQNLKDETFKNSIFEIWCNVTKFGIKWTDNLYKDAARTKYVGEAQKQSSLIK